jgi:hypothetical protein
MRPRSAARRAALAAAAAVMLTASAAAAPVSRTLEDQFGRAVEVRVGAGFAVVAVVSDQRSAAEEIAAWDEALAGLPSGTIVYRIADLKALPFFVPRGAVTKDLRGARPEMPVLLDWKGEASSALGAPKKTTAVLVFGPDGAEKGRVAGEASLSGALAVKDLLIGRK